MPSPEDEQEGASHREEEVKANLVDIKYQLNLICFIGGMFFTPSHQIE